MSPRFERPALDDRAHDPTHGRDHLHHKEKAMITPVTCGQCGKDLGLAYTPRDITRLQNNHTCKEKK